MNKMINRVNSVLKQNLSNPIVSTILHLFLVLYAGLAVPKLSGWLKVVFDNFIVRIVIIAIVAVLNNYNPALALSASIVFILTLQTLSISFNNDKLKDVVDTANSNIVDEHIVPDSVNQHEDVPSNEPNNEQNNEQNNEPSFVGANNDTHDGPYKSLENDFSVPYDSLNNDLSNNDY
tara:strand:- start:17 stop:547 length:531 start_codon:yes stop_codon:yes gene_type:complete